MKQYTTYQDTKLTQNNGSYMHSSMHHAGCITAWCSDYNTKQLKIM